MKRLILLLKLATSHGNSPHSDGSPRSILRVLLSLRGESSSDLRSCFATGISFVRIGITGTYRLKTTRN